MWAIYLLKLASAGIRQCVRNVRDDDASMGRYAESSSRGMLAFGSHRFIFPPEECLKVEFYERVATICARAKELIEKAVPLRALLFHLFASQQLVPEISITHLAIALDGTKTAVVEKIQGEGKLMPQADFRRRIQSVVRAAEMEFSAADDASKLEHLLIRINNSNNWSESKRWERFWLEYIKYDLTPEEARVLHHRGSAIYSAYILLTQYDIALNDGEEIDGRPYEVGWLRPNYSKTLPSFAT